MTTLTLSDREVGLLMRCLTGAEYRHMSNSRDNDFYGSEHQDWSRERAARIRTLRQKITAQRKRKAGLMLDFHAKGLRR
jgi:hypothetical protein